MNYYYYYYYCCCCFCHDSYKCLCIIAGEEFVAYNRRRWGGHG